MTTTRPGERDNSPASYELDFRLDADDLRPAAERLWQRLRGFRRGVHLLFWTLLVASVAAACLAIWFWRPGGVAPEGVVFACVVAAVAVVVAGRGAARRLDRRVVDRLARKACGVRRLRVDDRSLRLSRPDASVGDLVRHWEEVSGIETSGGELLFLDAAPTIVVPRDAFDGEAEFQRFVADVEVWHRAAQGR